MGSNFAFLEKVVPQLARLGRMAELLLHQDAPASIGKTRQLSELVAKQAAIEWTASASSGTETRVRAKGLQGG